METKQTAVEWLEYSLAKTLKRIVENRDFILIETLFEQAKQMEKEQMLDSFSEGYKSCACDNFNLSGKDFEEYYNETYNK